MVWKKGSDQGQSVFKKMIVWRFAMKVQFNLAARIFTLLASLMLALSLPGQSQMAAQQAVEAQTEQTGIHPIHIVPVVPRTGKNPSTVVGPVAMPVTSGPQLSYYGGQVISNVQIVVVFWGPNVDPIVTSGIAGFYQTITNSTYFDLASEYSTAGATVTGGASSTNQKIGRGTYLKSYTIAPSVCPTAPCTIDDTQIGPEIAAQINAGNLPKPTQDAAGYNNTLYVTYFPPGITITQGGNSSCVSGGFCAYHSTINLDSRELGYGVVPDFGAGSGCDVGCGNGTQFENVTAVSSHEMVEAVTDIGVALANALAPPLAWYDNNNGEIGDICNAQDVTASGYSVQLQWSNMQNACVNGPAQFQVTAPSSATAGTPISVAVTAQDFTGATITGYTGKVHIASTDGSAALPADYTFTTADNGTHTFNVTLQTNGSQSVTATDTVAAAVTGASGTITVSGGSGGSVSLSPSTVSFGNQTVGSTSSPQTATLTNGGTTSLSITNISASGDFAQTNTCGVSLAANASCAISVTFTPTAAGSRTGTLTVTDNASNSPQTASLSGTGVILGTDHLVLITSQAAQGANDSVAWSQLGADGTLLTANLSARSVNGLAVTGALAGPNSIPSVVCSASVCSWTGTGFPTGDTLIWTSDAGNGGNGPLTLTFGSGMGGGGALIQSDAPGQFTAQIQAYNSTTLLGTFTVTSDANGDPVYIGVQDQTAPNVTSLTFSLTNCASTCTDFAIDTAYLNGSGTSNTFPLTVAVSGSGSGVVTSTPVGISCPGTCSASFSSGTSVTLTEAAAAGSEFTGWSGACTGTGACSVAMTSAQSVTATFQAIAQTSTTLTVSSAQADVGSSVTFTANVAPASGTTTPTGTVTFNSGSVGLGVIQLVSGTATLTTSSLAAGSYSVTAAYSGDANSASSSSTPVAVMMVDVSVAASATSLTVSRGHTVSTTLTVTPSPLTGFNPTVTFSCSGLPAQSTCTFTPTSVTPNGGAATTTVSIQTIAASTCAQQASVSGHGSGWMYALLLPGLIGVLSLRRKQMVLNARFLVVVAALTVSLMGWTACSGSTSSSGGCTTSNPGTPTGNSTVIVTATTSGSNPISKQVTIALTVQ